MQQLPKQNKTTTKKKVITTIYSKRTSATIFETCVHFLHHSQKEKQTRTESIKMDNEEKKTSLNCKTNKKYEQRK